MATKSEINTLKAQVADSSHVLDNQGLVDFHGHVSARIPGTNSILIKPVLKAHNQVVATDIVTVDMDEYMAADGSQWNPSKQTGRVIDAPVPPRETMLHVAAYQHRPDVNSVVHTHQLVATAIGIGNVSIKPLYNQALPFAPETPIYQRPDLITNLALANEVAETLGDRNALLLRGHGVLVVGETVDHSVSNTIYLERTAIMQVIATIVGKPEALPDEYVARFLPDWSRRASHAYEYFRSLVPSLGSKG
jgi:ribulose-5-phosphate 4-epimerase/fuculose-1-phosphate aldolase